MRYRALRWCVPASLCGLAALLSGCPAEQAKGQHNADPRTPSSARAKGRVARSLIGEAARAELWDRGLLIDLGTPDQHKYTWGGWRTGWARVGAGRPTHAEVVRVGTLTFHDWFGGARGVKLRIRALQADQRLTVVLDGEELGSSQVGRAWQVLDFPLEQAPPVGRRRLALRFAEGSEKHPAAQVDWVWLRRGPGAAPAPIKVATVSFGEPRRALLSGPERSFSYYLQVPEQATLVFDYAGDPGLHLAVRATVDGHSTRELASLTAEPRWREGSVDLDGLAGEVVRLDLVTAGQGKRAAWGEPDLVCPGKRAAPVVVTAASRAKNLIYVLIDTARRDVYRPFNPKTEVAAPEMERFAADATRFTRAYSNTNWTLPSVGTVWSGMYPATHGATTKTSYFPEEVPVLSEHLRRHGFTTAAFIANGFTSDKFGFKRGWDTYRNYIREDLPSDAEHVYNDAISWLDRRQKRTETGRFFLYIQTIDAHVPYDPPESDRKPYFDGTYRGVLGPYVTGYETADYNQGKLQLGPDDHRYIEALYRAEITYHDRHFGRLMRHLERLGLLRNSLVVVSNDHGEELRDHGKYGHGHSLYEELVASPLLFRFPPLFAEGAEVKHIVELVDVLPTVLEALGVKPMRRMEGLSLLGTLTGQPGLVPGYAISEHLEDGRSVRVGRLKLMRWRSGKEELYDLQRDPGERQDLASDHPVARRAAAVYLGEGLGMPPKTLRLTGMGRTVRFGAKKAVMDPTLRRQLRALGYIN